MTTTADVNRLFRKLPQLGELLDSPAFAPLVAMHSRELVAEILRILLAKIREDLKASALDELSLEATLANLQQAVETKLRARLRPSLRRVINATGVILQTNLGRAPLSAQAIQQINAVACGYCNIEMDAETGRRSRRDDHAEQLILDVLALRAGEPLGFFHQQLGAAVVNNCAAATFLALNTLAEGGEVIVSRGELVEIGGGFRVPDILRKSGAVLKEVGTTNKTRIGDYAAAITPETRLILRVHRSNFRIEGFTERPELQDLIALGETAGVPVFEDQGTGCLVPLEQVGIPNESSWLRSATSGAALVACSGDKLLGGPQCGILTGTKIIIERIRANPLFRALRVDKLTYAALQATLLAYLSGDEASIPAIAMMRTPAHAIRLRCELWAAELRSDKVSADVIASESVVGGGTTPGASLPSFAVALQHAELNETALAALLRGLDPPVITRTSDSRVLLDLRTVDPAEDAPLLLALRAALQSPAMHSLQ